MEVGKFFDVPRIFNFSPFTERTLLNGERREREVDADDDFDSEGKLIR